MSRVNFRALHTATSMSISAKAFRGDKSFSNHRRSYRVALRGLGQVCAETQPQISSTSNREPRGCDEIAAQVPPRPLIEEKLTINTSSLRKIRGGHRFYSTELTANQLDALDTWITSPGRLVLSDSFTEDRLSDLYITLPTRDGTSAVYQEPQDSQPVGYGHHLAFFHHRTPETMLRPDGTDPVLCPPEPFTRRMWAGGSVTWNNVNPLLVGSKAKASSAIASINKKGFEKGTPMIFVNQQIQIAMQRSSEPSLTEIRSHVYLPSTSQPSNRPREVNDLPPRSDFSFTYMPTLTTLFRFSALTFNAHHIHLDKDITNGEGYVERLVHGPLTALMLLETVILNNPALKIKSFEYRAVNPMIVNHKVTIHGAWLDDMTARLWCIDQNGVVGMVGTIRKDV